MKKLLSVSLVLLLLVACHKTDTSNAKHTATNASSSSVSEVKAIPKGPASLNENINLKLQEIKADALLYKDTTCVSNALQNTLPTVLAVQNNKLFYMAYKTPEAVQKAKIKDMSQYGPKRRHFGYLDLQTSTKHEILLQDFFLGSADDDYAYYLLADDKLLLVYNSTSKSEKFKDIHTKLALLDFAKQTVTPLAEYATADIGGLSKIRSLNDHKLVFAINVVTNFAKAEMQQVVLTYDLNTKQLTELVKKPICKDANKEILNFDSINGEIYLLTRELKANKAKLFLQTYNKVGKEINKIELNALDEKFTNMSVLNMLVEGNLLFIEFKDLAHDPNGKSACVVLEKKDNSFILKDTSNMSIATVPNEHSQAAQPLILQKYTENSYKTGHDYYAYYPETNKFDLLHLKPFNKGILLEVINVGKTKLLMHVQGEGKVLDSYYFASR